MRTFIGIDLSKSLKAEIAGIQSEFRRYASAGRWKYIDNFHLTLKFLGETDKKQLVEIDKHLTELSRDQDSFSLHLSELGSFPGKGFLRVLYLKLDGDIDKLRDLQHKIEDKLEGSGFTREKRGYTPHITIAQDVIFDRPMEDMESLIGEKAFSELAVDRIYLIKSEQVANKRLYTPLDEYKFRDV